MKSAYNAMPGLVLCLILSTINAHAQPAISSFAPVTGAAGSTVTLTGSAFNTTAANNIVYFGAVRAAVISATATQLSVTVPTGASTAKISVTDITTGLSATSGNYFIATFTPSGLRAFATKISLPTARKPWGVATGDFDGDGLADLATATSSSSGNAVSVFKNTSTTAVISFAAVQNFAVAGTDVAQTTLIAADINGDGKLDLIVATATNSFTILINTSTAGNINFAAAASFPTDVTFRISYLTVADMDGDGKPDVIVSNSNNATSYASVFRNTSAGGVMSFAARVDAMSVAGASRAIVVSDMNADRKPDIAMLNGGNISVVPNNSSAGVLTFGTKINIATGSVAPIALDAGDMDGDGLPELATGSSADILSIPVFRNTSTGGVISFAAAVTPSSIAGTDGVFIADFDGDGKPDIGLASTPAGNTGYIKNNSTTGSLSLANAVRLNPPPLYATSFIISVDLDGDSKPEYVSNDQTNTGLQVYRNISADPYLTALPSTAGALTPAFAKNTYNYTLSVAATVSSIQFTPTLEDPVGATIKVNTVLTANNAISLPIPLVAGNNTITVVGTAESGATQTYTIVVNRPNGQPAVTVGASPIICQGVTSASLPYSNPVNSPLTYSIAWNATALAAGLTNVTDQTLPATPVALNIPAVIGAAVYNGSITVKNSFGTGTPVAFTLTVNAVPTVAPLTGIQAVCAGSATTFSTATSGGVWASSNIQVATVSAGGTITGIAAGTANITYTVTNANNCVTVVSRSVTVNDLPVVPAITGVTFFCLNGTTQLSNAATGGTWSTANNNIATINSATGLVTGVAPGTVTVSYAVTNANNCVTVASTSITVNDLPVVPAITGAASLCVNGTTQLSNTATGGVWSAATNNIAAISSATGLVTGVASGTVTVSYTVTNANNCVTVVSRSVTVNDLPVVPAITGVTSLCLNGATQLSNSVTGGTWSTANNTIATVNSATGLVTGVAPGTATVLYVVTNANGCTSSVNTNVTVVNTNGVGFAKRDTLICKATSITLSPAAPANATYAWTAAGSSFSSSAASVNVSAADLYRVRITLTNGCAINDSVNLRNTADTAIKAKVSVTSQAFINQRIQAVNLTYPKPQSQAWVIPASASVISSNDTTVIFTMPAAGLYPLYLKTTSYNVCSSVDSSTIIINKKDSSTVSAARTPIVIREVNISPNPGNGLYNVSVQLNKPSGLVFRIYSITGLQVFSSSVLQTSATTVNLQVNITSQNKGVYIMVVEAGEDYRTRTLLKN